ncbi:hypothetical protein Fmac_014468 [Flemingia macrophylla]|uniref:Factor of DNA methylation 1-5/IDN2 domain-containing protein n=1 Tax=Flemingia macrophylla TaxID=520843 RepID=A0ABD1MBU8_9FABA
MANRSCDKSSSKQSIAFASLKEMIESQKQKIIDVEYKYVEKSNCMSKLNESLKMITSMAKQDQKELKQMKVMNTKMRHDLECIKKENDIISKELEECKKENDIQKKKFAQENGLIMKELEESKALNEMHQKKFMEETRKNVIQIGSLQVALKQKNNNNVSAFSEELKVQNEQLNAKVIQLEKQLECSQKLEVENQQLEEKLDVMKHMEDEFLNMVGALHMNVVEKERLLKDSEDFNQSLIIQERQINDELQNARKKLIEGIAGTSSIEDGNICVKQMGEIDSEPFLKAFMVKRRYNEEKAQEKALEKCSLWQQHLGDPHWYPFKIITFGGKSKEIINEEDERLKRLKWEMGVGVYKAVVAALTEMNEYNPSGRFMIRELWNREEEKRATLEEGIEVLLNQTRTKKRKIDQMEDEISNNGETSAFQKGVC